MPEHVGTATIKIVPDTTGFTEAITKAQHAIVLHGFVVWLAKLGLLNIGGQGWHGGLAALVDRYIAATEGDESASES